MKSSKQRKYEMWAAYVWWISIAISSTFGYLNQSGMVDKHGEKPATQVVLFFFHLMMAGLGYLVWKGYRWAKVLMLAALVYGVAASFYHFSKGENLVLLNSQAGFHSIVQWLLSIAIATLLILSFMPAKPETVTEDWMDIAV